MKLLSILLLVFAPFFAFSWQLRGIVLDEKGEPIAYASIYEKETTYGVASNIKGEYLMNLKNGEHIVVFQAVGFEKEERKIRIDDANQTLNIILVQNSQLLKEVEISADKEDPAYPIIRKAIAARRQNNKSVNAFECDAYSKVSLEKEFFTHDTLSRKARDTIQNSLVKERMKFIETKSKLYFEQPNNWKEVKSAVHDLDANKPESAVSVIVSGYGEDINYGSESVDRQMFKTNLNESRFNFYENLLDVPAVGPVPFTSPIGATALLNYNYKLEGTFYEAGFWINKILVEPKRKYSALFSGVIYITDSIWSIKAVDLEPDKNELIYYDYLRIFQEYQWVNDSIWLIGREEFFYETKDWEATEIGNTNIVYENYNLDPIFAKRFFGNEVMRVEDDAYDKSTSFWDSIRPLELKEEEILFLTEHDSLDNYYASALYMAKADSTVNQIDFWDIALTGINHQNSFKKTSWAIIPIVQQFNLIGVGGYRHRLGGSYTKEFSKATKLRTDGELNYGFLNQDLKGEIRADILYKPKRFAHFHAEYRNNYEMLNNFASFSTILSGSNYVLEKFYSFGHEFELLNGVYFDATLEFGQTTPIDDLELSPWSNDLFGDFNEPVAFKAYNEFGLDIKVRLTPFQKYQTKPYKKVVLPSKWPSLIVWYKKGIPGILNSVSNLDFLELKLVHEIQLGTSGVSKWVALAGSYLNDKNVQIADYKFFRRSDLGFFSNPLKSFQLLYPDSAAIFTTRPYFQLNYLHNFEGVLLNKIPIVRRLKLQSVAGFGGLILSENSIKHTELFAGIERPTRIKKQLFKFGLYYNVGGSSNGSLQNELKFGIDFFNDFTNRWSY